MVLEHPITAKALFGSPEMALRYPSEAELEPEGFDEGQGHGWDDMDRSAVASRVIAVSDDAQRVVDWFVAALTEMGWVVQEQDGLLRRYKGESVFIRVDRDRGASRVAGLMTDDSAREMQESFEQAYYSSAPTDSTIVTIFYNVAES